MQLGHSNDVLQRKVKLCRYHAERTKEEMWRNGLIKSDRSPANYTSPSKANKYPDGIIPWQSLAYNMRRTLTRYMFLTGIGDIPKGYKTMIGSLGRHSMSKLISVHKRMEYIEGKVVRPDRMISYIEYVMESDKLKAIQAVDKMSDSVGWPQIGPEVTVNG